MQFQNTKHYIELELKRNRWSNKFGLAAYDKQ